MSAELPSTFHVAITVAALGLFAGLFVYGTWFKGTYGGRFDPRGLRQTGQARRHEARLLLVFLLMAAAFGGMIASSPELRGRFCLDTPVWPGCAEAP